MSVAPDASLRDDPTGLSSRRHFDIVFDFLFNIADRGVPLTVVFFRLDPGGDGDGEDDLAGFAEAMASATRTTDLAARFSDSTLVALLVDCNQQGGLIYADRVMDAARPFLDRRDRSMSVGLAAYEKGMAEAGDLVTRAEAALEGALRRGGNRIVVPSDLEEAR